MHAAFRLFSRRARCLGGAALMIVCFAASPVGAVIEETDVPASDTTIMHGVPSDEMENPRVIGNHRSVRRWVDIDGPSGGGWGKNGNLDGNGVEGWLLDTNASIYTSVSSTTGISIHMRGDNNDGVAQIKVDGNLKVELDMWTGGGYPENVQVLIEGLSEYSSYTVLVDDMGSDDYGDDDVAVFGLAELGGTHVEYMDSGVDFFEGMVDAAMEQNGVPPSHVQGRRVVEYLDAYPGGGPPWVPEGSVGGSDSQQAWISNSTGAIETVTTVPSNILAVHLQGFDYYSGNARGGSGRGRILVDGVVKATLDLWHDSDVLGGITSGTRKNEWNVQVIIRGLGHSVHTIRVEGLGSSTHGGESSDNDFSVWGAAVLEPDPVTVDDDLQINASLFVHALGNDSTGGTTPPGYFALPLGARCGATTTNAANYCSATVRGLGQPIRGKGTVSPTAYGFGLGSGVLTGIATGSLPSRSPFLYSATYATILNAGGFFSSGGGPGALMLTRPGGTVQITPGGSQFGGTMRLLGRLGAVRSFVGPTSSYWNGTHTWNLLPVLGGAISSTNNATATVYNATAMSVQTLTLEATGFPWTTGSVGVFATGPFSTSLYRSGYDYRTPTWGYGTLQLVSPALVSWRGPDGSEEFRGLIAILNIKFLPEPRSWVLLAAGAGALALLRRASRRG